MKAIIVDDETAARAIVVQLCTKVQNIELLGEFTNAVQAIKFLNKNTVDIVFLDIHMPGDFTGFDFIETLKNPPHIILITSDSNFAVNAFEYPCILDYLTKPIKEERFFKAIEKVNLKVSSNGVKKQKPTEDLFVNIDRRLVKIKLANIYLIEAKGDYVHIKTQGKNYIVHTTLKKIHEKLPDNLFLKVHRSYIINTSKIIDIEDNSVLIEKDVVPVSRTNKEALIQRLNLL